MTTMIFVKLKNYSHRFYAVRFVYLCPLLVDIISQFTAKHRFVSLFDLQSNSYLLKYPGLINAQK